MPISKQNTIKFFYALKMGSSFFGGNSPLVNIIKSLQYYCDIIDAE